MVLNEALQVSLDNVILSLQLLVCMTDSGHYAEADERYCSYPRFERHALDQLTYPDAHAGPRTKTTTDLDESLLKPCEMGLGTGTLWAVVYMWSS